MEFDQREETIHGLAARLLGPSPTDARALCVMILLHTHEAWFAPPVGERTGPLGWAALTQRSSADAIAKAWPDRADAQRTRYTYWYNRYITETPYEIVEEIPEPLATQVASLRDQLAGYPEIARVEVED
jgi:hypothetical protein